MYNYSDSVTWYVSDELLNAELPLFTEVYTVFTAEVEGLTYSTFSELQSKFSYTRVTAFSVERFAVDEIMLTCRYVLGSPTINSLALVTEYNGESYLLAKITRDSSAPSILPNGYDRIFRLKLPYKINGSTKVYPNFSCRLKKYTNSPIGEELVTVGEHHHSVDWGGVNNRDSVPALSPSLGRYIASSKLGEQDGFGGEKSFVYNENGTLNQNMYASITGSLVNSGGDISSSFVDRLIATDAVKNLLANVMEEYLMATNSIQILGHEIPSTEGYNDLATNDKYLLYVDKVSASGDRNLKAITSSDFRKWLVQKYNYDDASTCITDACVNIISSIADVTVTMNKTSQLALVSNVKPVTSDINGSIAVKWSGNSTGITAYPRETVVVLKDSNGNYSGFKFGSTDLLRSVLSGTYGFSKVSFSRTAGSDTLIDDCFLVNNNGKVDSELYGNIEISGDTKISGTLGVTGATTLDDTLEVKKNASIGTTLGVAAESLVVTGKASVGGDLGVTGKAALSNTLTVTEATTLTGGVDNGLTINSGNFEVTDGTAKINKQLTVESGGADITGNSKVTGTFTTTDKVIISSGGLEIESGDISAEYSSIEANSLNVSSDVLVGGDLEATGDVKAANISADDVVSAAIVKASTSLGTSSEYIPKAYIGGFEPDPSATYKFTNVIVTGNLTVGKDQLDTASTVVVSGNITSSGGFFIG